MARRRHSNRRRRRGNFGFLYKLLSVLVICAAVVMALTLLPVQVMMLPNYLVCRAFGLLNTRLAIVLLGVFSPLAVFLLARAMQRIGREQSEAASLDGAGEWTLFRRIYLPQVKDTAYIAAGLAFLDQWSMVELPLVLLSDESKQPLSILLIFAAPYA